MQPALSILLEHNGKRLPSFITAALSLFRQLNSVESVGSFFF